MRAEVQTYFGEHLSFFGRGEAFFDEVFADSDDYKGEIRTHAAYNCVDALEYYLEGKYGDFTVRAGRQIVQWGESLAPIFADFTLPQQQLPKLRLGLPVEVTTDALPGEPFKGQITAINPLVDAETRQIKVQSARGLIQNKHSRK